MSALYVEGKGNMRLLRHEVNLSRVCLTLIAFSLVLLAAVSRRDSPFETTALFSTQDQSEYRFPRDTEVVDDPPSGWAYTAHVQRDSDGGIEKIDVPNNAVVKRVADGWSIELPRPVPRDLYDTESYLPRGNHLYRRQFTDKQWAEKKLLEKFFRAESGQPVDFESHNIHEDGADDWDIKSNDQASTVNPIFGGIRDCEDIDCYLDHVNGDAKKQAKRFSSDDSYSNAAPQKDSEDFPNFHPVDSDTSVAVAPQKDGGDLAKDFGDLEVGREGGDADPKISNDFSDSDVKSEGCGVSCLISFLSNAVASKRPRPAKPLDPISSESAEDADEDENRFSEVNDVATKGTEGNYKNQDNSQIGTVRRSESIPRKNEVRIRRSQDGRISEILIPSDAVLSSSASGLSIRPRKQRSWVTHSGTILRTQEHVEPVAQVRAITDTYSPNQDPYYCMHGGLAAECGNGPPSDAPRHDYSLGWKAEDGSQPDQIRRARKAKKQVGFSMRGLRRVVREFVNALRASIEVDPRTKKNAELSQERSKQVTPDEPKDSNLNSKNLEMKRQLKEYLEQISDLNSVMSVDGDMYRDGKPSVHLSNLHEKPSALVSRDSATRLMQENAELTRKLQSAKARLKRMQFMLNMGQTQDRAVAPLPSPTESLALLPSHSAPAVAGGILESWLRAAEANDLARLQEDRSKEGTSELYEKTQARSGGSVEEKAAELAVDAAASASLEREATHTSVHKVSSLFLSYWHYIRIVHCSHCHFLMSASQKQKGADVLPKAPEGASTEAAASSSQGVSPVQASKVGRGVEDWLQVPDS